MQILKRLIITLVLFYLIGALYIYNFPHHLYYGPSIEVSNIENARQNGFPANLVEYQAADGTNLIGWYVQPTSKKDIIIFLHGNSFNIETFFPKVRALAQAGYGVLMAEYRGFGGLPGKISEDNLLLDSLAAVSFAHSQGFKNQNIILYGYSLGTYLAGKTVFDLQKTAPFKALILETPFDSLVSVVKLKAPYLVPSFLIKDHYDTISFIDQINSPILIMAGSEDTLVPEHLAEKLYNKANNPKTYKIFKGAGHNNLLKHGNDKFILNWLENGKNTAKK